MNARVKSGAANAEGAKPPAPAVQPMPGWRAMGYFTASLVLALSQAFSQYVISANLQQLQGGFGATRTETMWLSAAYLAPNVSMSLALIKIRAQYGLRNFAEISILGFVLAAFLNYAANSLDAAVAVRFMAGMAAAPMTSLAFLYMLEPLPQHRKLSVGLSLSLTFIFLGSPLTRLVSPHLLQVGLWDGLATMEVALAMIGFGLIYMLPLASPPHRKVIHSADVVSYLLIAIGMGALAIAFTLGTSYWWLETRWVGGLLILSIVTLTTAAIIELNRENPLLDIRWITSPPVLHFAAALLLFRIVLAEQTSGTPGLFRALGIYNAEMQPLFALILAATVAGGIICAFLLRAEREPYFHVVALVLLIIGASMDAHVTSQTRPHNMYVSQTLIALASALFLAPAMSSGLISALKRGRDYLLSFIIIFLTTQKLGGILGAAIFSTFITLRRQLHLERLVESFPATDQFVRERIAQTAGSYGSLLADAGARNAQALATLKSQATVEATVLAYNDAFHVIALISAGALACLIIHIGINAWRARLSAAAEASAVLETS